MPYLSTAAAGRVLAASARLADARTTDELAREAAVELGALTHAEIYGRVEIGDPDTTRFHAMPGDGLGGPHSRGQRLQLLREHPVLRHYAKAPHDVSPLRVSDVIPLPAWRSSRLYLGVFAPLNQLHQLAFVTERGAGPRMAGYAVTRSGRNFDDDAVTAALALQPVLAALHRAVAAPPPKEAEQARAELGLTPRELDVLTLLATGMTAVAIGRARGISSRTVTKHLEHVYAKLGCHDRLSAVDRGRAAGLLPPQPGTAARRS